MQFKKLANSLIQEAKDERPGQRYHNVKNRTGPSGISSSPIGRDDYNPEIVKPSRPAFKDDFTGTEQAVAGRNTDIILKNAFRLIKSDAGFRKQINTVLEAFAKKRKSITMAQEKVLTLNPAHIDKLYGQMLRLERVVAALQDDPRAKTYVAELEKVTAQHTAVSDQLEGVIEDVKDILGVNEESSLKAQDAVIKIIQATAHEQYEALVKGLTDEEKATIILRSLDQLEAVNFSEEALEQEELRIQLLSSLLSDDEEVNPLYQFFHNAQKNYEATIASDNVFKKVKAFTQNVTVETIFNRLPLNAFATFYNATRDDLPLRPLTGARRKQAKAASPIRAVLDQIVDGETWEVHRSELLELVDGLTIDDGRMSAIKDILSGPYLRRGASAVQRLKGLLRGILQESSDHTNFDLMLLETLSKYGVS